MHKNILLEGIEVNDLDTLIAWVDILGNKIYLKDLVSSNVATYDYPYTVSNIFEVDAEKAVLLDDHGIAEFFWGNQTINRVFEMQERLAHIGFRGNDGVKLGEKKFLFGTMHKETPEEKPGAVWLLNDGHLTKVSKNTIPNLFVNTGEVILVADSYKKIIFSHSVSTGLVEGVWVNRSHLKGEPDGGCLSRDRGVYIANWGASEILKYSLDGCYIGSRRIHALQPSCCRIARGKLCVTTASVNMTPQEVRQYPQSGTFLEVETF